MYNVFADMHHAGLLQSLILLFERRLGGKLYRPIGREWFDKGYWAVYNHPATIEQFLGVGGNTPDGSPKLNEVVGPSKFLKNPIIYECHDIDSGQTNNAITFEGFMAMPFDIVIASLPYHIEPFKMLCDMHPSKPKLIFQIGNAWTVEAGLAPNIMASALISGVPENINFIQYHQEFDTDIFYPDIDGKESGPFIYSFVNVFNGQSHFAADWDLFQKVEQRMPEWVFKSYGGQCRDGAVGPANFLAHTMRSARFIWHTKAGGDGYGHIIHNAPAVARPLIVKKEYYHGKMAESLLQDGVTCITIDGLSEDEIIKKIEHYNQPEQYHHLCMNAYGRFQKEVNFDNEQKAIELFLEKLL